jgi:UDP-N-acetylmuramyl pentapeptide phosphotransferase/UDP-N-acetylglucosamine-1-phosphate transferase
MDLIIPASISLIVFLICKFVIHKYSVFFSEFLDSDFVKPQSFHDIPTLRIGGVFLCAQLAVSAIFYSQIQIFFSATSLLFANFLLGFIDDGKIVRQPLVRFCIFLLVNLGLIIFFDIKINRFDIVFLDYINSFLFFSYLITLFAIFFVVNGSNLIDGYNGLLSIHGLIIFSILLFICLKLNLNDYFNYFFLIYLVLFFFIFLNFPKALYFLGDNGSFFVGSALAYFVILISNFTSEIPPFFYAIILHYIFFEIFFSVFRKLFEKKNPFYPDKLHLHMLIFLFLRKKYSLHKSNYLTSVYINFSYLIILFPVIYFYDNGLLCKIYFFILFLFYLLIYLFFRNVCKKLIKL